MPSARTYHHWFCLLLLPVIIFGLLGGCAGIQKTDLPPGSEYLPPIVELETVPFYPQSKYQCGPSALAMALTYSELPITPEELQSQVYTPSKKGSLQMAMIGATRRRGRIAYTFSEFNSIWPELAAGHPVIVLQNLGLSWLPVWHYAVVIGYDFSEHAVILRSGITERKLTPLNTFEKTWSRSNFWGLIVLKPSQLPAIATEKNYLKAVLGLEKARQYQAAVEGYQAALTRWPQSLVAFMGLGNSRYALGDLQGAENAFRMAVKNHPRAAGAYNNLAQVLYEQGRREEALEAAKRAVAIGGPMTEIYESTLEAVQQQY